MPHPSLTASAEQLAWLAGFIDGEGSIGVTFHKQRKTHGATWAIKLRISNTDKDSLIFANLLCNCLGKIYKHPSTKEKPRYKQGYVLHFDGRKAEPVIQAILPYLFIKKQRAELALQFLATVKSPGHKTTAQEKEIRNNIHRQLTALNRRGEENYNSTSIA